MKISGCNCKRVQGQQAKRRRTRERMFGKVSNERVVCPRGYRPLDGRCVPRPPSGPPQQGTGS